MQRGGWGGDNIQEYEGEYISKLDSSDPEDAVICGRGAITHLTVLQSKDMPQLTL